MSQDETVNRMSNANLTEQKRKILIIKKKQLFFVVVEDNTLKIMSNNKKHMKKIEKECLECSNDIIQKTKESEGKQKLKKYGKQYRKICLKKTNKK